MEAESPGQLALDLRLAVVDMLDSLVCTLGIAVLSVRSRRRIIACVTVHATLRRRGTVVSDVYMCIVCLSVLQGAYGPATY